ncbi:MULTISPECIES: hypothetical protein [Nostocales]|uniref:hypothetical protein n=1 Tax=Nostocales TaxID=1161 RepID=UPI0004B02189|nr:MULTISPECIES: hypothetical protein [Nostocales]
MLASALEWEAQDSQEAIDGIQRGLDDFEAARFRSFDEFALYSRFLCYEVHNSPLIACGERVGGGVLVPHDTGKCCNNVASIICASVHEISHLNFQCG